MKKAALLVALAAASVAGAQTPTLDQARRLLGGPQGRPLQAAALEAETEQAAALLRCPVCQGLSVADSPTGLARDMKAQARELLAAGYDRGQVLAYFESSYGEFVRLQPARRGVNWLVWMAPVLGLLLGAAVIARALRKEPAVAARVAPPEVPAVDPGLEPYLRRVRALAYGWSDDQPAEEQR